MNTDLDFGVNPTTQYDQVGKSDLDDDNFFGLDLISNSSLLPNDDLENGLIKNQFYVGTNTSTVSKMTDVELFSKYKRCIAICLKNGQQASQLILNGIYQKILKQSEFESLSQYYTLYPVSVRLLKNNLHRQSALLLDRPLLSSFNSSNIALENTEIIVPLFEINEDVVRVYNAMYEPANDFNTLVVSNVLYQYFNADSYKGIILERMARMTHDLKETTYWTNPYFCAINITNAFQARTFKFKEQLEGNLKAVITSKQSGIQDKDAKVILEKITNKAKGYDLQNIYRKTVFTDASSAVNDTKQKYKLYKVEDIPISITKDQVNDIFKSINDNKIMFNVFNSFLLSKTHCHLVLNNQFVLEKMQPFFKGKFMAFYNYIFAYAWVCMYLEECIVKTRTLKTKRYVFEINTANKLPFFPYFHENIHMNPYCTLTVDEKVLKSKDNCHGLPMITDYKEYGVDTLEGFKTKFNLFTVGKTDKNIFDGLETHPNSSVWKYFAVSGSIIPACVQKRSPLIDQVTTPEMSFPDRISRYFNEYYNESDIDLMCNSKSVFEYMDNINKLLDVIKKNLSSVSGRDVSGTVELEPIKSLCVIVHSKYIEEQMKEMGTLEFIINNINSPAIKERFYEEYFSCKRDKNKQHRSIKSGNSLYEHFYKIVPIDDMNVMVTTYEITKETQYETDSDTYVYLNDLLPSDKHVPKEQNLLVLKISENIKFKIRSPHMTHSIEAFRTRYDDFFSCVSRFHLPCVRGYYNGDNVYLLPSCITALMTFTNIDYKYFAGIRDPIDIIDKYRMRGFGTMINDQEKNHVTEYNSSTNRWKGLFTVDNKSKSSINAQFSPKKLNDNIYKPGRFLRDLPDDTYRKVNVKYIDTNEDYYNYFKVNFGYTPGAVDFLKFHAIKEDGSIEPLKKWIIDAAYDELK